MISTRALACLFSLTILAGAAMVTGAVFAQEGEMDEGMAGQGRDALPERQTLGGLTMPGSLPSAMVRPEESLAAFQPEEHEIFLASLAGEWTGLYTFSLDDDEGPTEIPVAISARTPSDGGYLVQEATYQDPEVRVFTASILTSDGEQMTEVFVRNGQMQSFTYSIDSMSVRRGGRGTMFLVMSTEASEAGRPAELRVTYSLSGNVLSRRKDVRFLDEDASTFGVRSELRLTRIATNLPRPPGVEAYRQRLNEAREQARRTRTQQ
jgi:hypothetical protein